MAESFDAWARQPLPADAPDNLKSRYLRALYRLHRPSVRWNRGKSIIDQAEQSSQWHVVLGEFRRLHPGASDELLANLIQSVWIEERELKGQRYDRVEQAWLDRDGKRVSH